ncbi:MAG: ribosomal protein S18-alanine N-acetyltransferase [Burkholderiales bacterium]
MSALPSETPQLAPMREADLAQVTAIERTLYAHPWTRGNFADALRAGYQCRSLRQGREWIGYFVLMVAAGEAHLLNLSIAAAHQRQGHGSTLLRRALAMAREGGAASLFLEVRPSNLAALALYARFGFERIALRRGYYPAHSGREDALVCSLAL